MAVREIKTSITLDGEQAFRQAIAAANKELRVSQSELKAVASAYDLSGDRMTMLANKQRSLGDMVNQQENITNALRRNLKELEQAYEHAGRGVEEYRDKLRQAEASGNQSEIEKATKALQNAEIAYERAGSKVQDYRIQVNNAEDKLNKLNRSAQDVDREIEELGRDSVKAGRQIEDGIGDSAEEAEKDVRSLVQTLKDDLSSIRASTTFTAIGSLWDMATDAYSSVSGFVEGTQEYRRQLSYLELNAGQAGWGMEKTAEKLYEVQAMTGEASSAIEGLSNLLMVGIPKDNQFTRVMEALLGATVKLPDTANFEGLAEGFRETIATGEAAGQMVNMLEQIWGADAIEKINSALKESATLEGDIEAVLAVLEKDGQLGDAYAKYREENAELIAELETIARLEYQSARVGEIISRNITTPIKGTFADVLKWMADEMEKFGEDPKGYLGEAPVKAVTEIANKIGTYQYRKSAYHAVAVNLSEKGTEEATKAAEAIENVISTAYGLQTLSDVAGLANESKRAKTLLRIADRINWSDLADSFFSEVTKTNTWRESGVLIPGRAAEMHAKAVELMKYLDEHKMYEIPIGPPTAQQHQWREDAERWIKSSYEMGNYIAPIGGGKEYAYSKFNDARDAVWNAFHHITANWESRTEAKEAGKKDAEDYLEGWETMVMDPDKAVEAEGFERVGEESGSAIEKGMMEKLEEVQEEAYKAGEAIAMNFGLGLGSKVSYVAMQSAALAAAAAKWSPAKSSTGVAQVTLNVDGRQMAYALAPYNSEVMAVTMDATTPFQMR